MYYSTFRSVLRTLLFLSICFGVVSRPATVAAQDSADNISARSLVHILDYIALDYSSAISNGEIVDQVEYEEIRQFSETAVTLMEELVSNGYALMEGALYREVSELREGVRQRRDPGVIASDATTIRRKVISLTGLRIAPSQWPDLLKGKQLFAEYCSLCHGSSGAGDGPAASALTPRPSDFVGGERIPLLAPFQVYNTMRLGVEGTAMQAFGELSDQDVWNLAFFVKSLKDTYQETGQNDQSLSVAELRRKVSLERVATLNDSELEDVLDRAGVKQQKNGLAALRTTASDVDSGSPLDAAEEHLKTALTLYTSKQFSAALQEAIAAYLEGIEPVEPSLAVNDPELTVRLERQMMEVRSAIQKRASNDEVASVIRQTQASIVQARNTMQAQDHSAWFVFTMATSILLREGLEAFLIIIAMLGAIQTAGQKRAAAWIHGGWILAVLVGLAFWFLTGLLMQFGASQRELMEGGISLFAVVVLLYVGFWLHNKTSAQKWNAFIDEKIYRQMKRGSLLGLSAIAFFAVFREAFESVLFLSALVVEDAEHTGVALALATLTSLTVVLGLGALVLRWSLRIPTKHLFFYLSLLVGFLAVVLAGKGVHALQEAGRLSVTSVPFSIRLDLIGLYPTAETMIAQTIILGIAVVLWFLPLRLQRPAKTNYL
ncbi:MAG: cytochrome c/FTR1 family iron permease [Rhodothermia bacterium]|nr:MAG: cytochrome c/FTR1 family iron permease [Rhodothermia bacterium]